MSIRDKPIAVLGAGAWGTALAICLAQNQQETRLWGNNVQQLLQMQAERMAPPFLPDTPLPPHLTALTDLQAALADVEDVLLVVPSHVFREVITILKPYQTPAMRMAWATKGLDPSTGGLLSGVVSEVLGEHIPQAVLSGPSFAKEVAQALPTAVSLASNNAAFEQDLIQRFHSAHFRIYENSDMIGVQLCGTLKNVLAIAAGISDGLKLGANARSALITRGLTELSRLCVAAGGQSSTVMSLAGVGDVVLTCTDNQSRNRRFGLALAEGRDASSSIAEMGQVVEGYGNAKQLYGWIQRLKVDMPICTQVYKILYEALPLETAIQELLSRVPGDEGH